MAFRFPVSKPLTAMYAAILALAACSGGDNGVNETSIIDRIVISPDSLTVDPSQIAVFSAVGTNPAGDRIPVSITWTASGGTIDANGVYVADTAIGSYEVRATDASGHVGKALVQTRKRMQQVILVPAIASVETGAALQFQAYGINRAGDSIAIAVTYSATGGSVTTGGLYSAGSSAGTYRVIAAANGLADTSLVTITTTPPPPGVAVLEMTPSSASVDLGSTFQLRATARDASGNAMTGQTITWTSASPGVATVDGTGLVAGLALGTAVITATTGGLSATATITVVPPPPPPVATVSVSPSSATVNQGATLQLSATLRDASGSVLTGRTVSWTSGNTGVATVDANGLVRGVAAGNATITATSEGHSGSAAITVPAPPPPSPSAECAAPRAEWIWCDDFEQDRLSRYFEYDAAGGNFARTGGTGYNASTGMRAHFNVGSTSAGSLHLAIGKTPSTYFRSVDAGTANYREIYWRMYVKNQAGWVGGGADKLSRAFVFANSSWAEAAIGHVWSGSPASGYVNNLLLDPASGTDASGNLLTTGYNDFAHLTWLGQARSTTPIFDAAHVGQWFCVEAHMRLNSAGSSDGVLELWINGSPEGQRTGLNFLGSFSAYGINAVFFENYWNAGSPASQDRFFDNFVVSTARIGCTS